MSKKKIQIKANWFDNTIGFFSPEAKARRLRAKYKAYFLENYARKYDGAGKGRRTAGWRANSSSAIAETELSLHTLRNRSRDLRRNSAYISRAVQVITSNVVGKGIQVQFNGPTSRAKRIQQLWNQWTISQNLDFEGRLNINMLQDMVMDAIVESGESLLRKRRRVPTDENPFPIQVQLLESDFINDSVGSMFRDESGMLTLQGIEFDENGKKVNYLLYQDHPGSSYSSIGSDFTSFKIPADELIHSYRADRPGQIRGVPWTAPVMINIKDLEDYEDTQLVRQKISACFTAFIVDQETGNGISEAEMEDLERFEPGMIEKLSAGKTIEMATPPTVQNYNEYITTMLHKIATGLGISYESLTGDLSQVNFSSARMGWLEMSRNIQKWQQSIMIDQVLRPLISWFYEALDLLGVNRNGIEVSFVTPAREMIDPTKEVPAKIKAIRAGLMTLNEAILEQGKDPAKHFEQYSADMATIDQNNFIFDSDPRKVTQSGLAQNNEEE
jgi:lambda family phage portal protein